jgi:hypothetical protein
MMKHRFIALCMVAMMIVVWRPSAIAAAALFGSEQLDPRWCGISSLRQTVVYIDDMLMIEGKTDWATKLNTKLKASLAPGERVTVVRLSPASGQSREIWTGCWPAYSPTEQARMADQGFSLRDFFTKNKESDLEDQQKLFIHDFGAALTDIYNATKRAPSATRIDPASPPEKNILRALTSDEGRFSQSQTTIRAVLYSDLAEKSDLGSVFSAPTESAKNYGRTLGTYLRRGIFYVYGVAEDVTKSATVIEPARRFWSSALASMSASVGGIGTDLNMPNSIPTNSYLFNIVLTREGEDLDGRLSLLVDRDGVLIDSWVTVTRLSIATVTGTFGCQSNTESGSCRLQGTTNDGIVTTATTEDLTLSGNVRDGLTGQLGVRGASFPIKALRSDLAH